MKYTKEEINRLDKFALRYPLRYFDEFRVQRQFFDASLSNEFFTLWFNSLTDSGKDLKRRFSIASSSCTWLLLLHRDCPDWLRDHYKTFSRVEGRRAALLYGSQQYQFDNLELILADRSHALKEQFFLNIENLLEKGESVNSSVVLKALKFASSSENSYHHRKKFRSNPIRQHLHGFLTVQKEGVASLVNPDPKIRGKAMFYYDQTDETKKQIEKILNFSSSKSSTNANESF